MISPSQIALHAAGFDPVNEYILEKQTNCVMCGIGMNAGAPAAAWNPTSTFTNWSQLRAPESKHVCPHCAGAWRSEFTQAWVNGAIYNEHGVHKTNSMDTLAHALLHPPKTPFVWARGDQKIQHLVWRTPVTIDENMLMVRLGEKIAAIRRLVVLDALKSIREAGAKLDSLPKELRPVKKANPGNESGIFKYLDWGIDNVDHSLLSDGFLKLANSNEQYAKPFAELKTVLQNLNFGEVWALMVLLKSRTPIQPPLVATPKTIK